MSASSCS